MSPHWPESKWRSLKVKSSLEYRVFLLPSSCYKFFLIVFSFPFQVQWDELASILRPDRVSPWEIEPFVAPTSPNMVQSVPIKNKRPRPPLEIPGIAETFNYYICLGSGEVRISYRMIMIVLLSFVSLT